MYIIADSLGDNKLKIATKGRKNNIRIEVQRIEKSMLRENLEYLNSILDVNGLITIRMIGLGNPTLLLNKIKKSKKEFAFPFWERELKKGNLKEIDAGIVIADIKSMEKILKKLEFQGMKFFVGNIRRFNSLYYEKKEATKMFNYILKNDSFKEGRELLLKNLVFVKLLKLYTINDFLLNLIKQESAGIFNKFKGAKTEYGFFVELIN